MKSIHDNICHGFEFNGQQNSLILHTTFSDESTQENTDVIFSNVWTHHIEGIQDGNILFDIRETDYSTVQATFSDVFQRLENQAWPVEKKQNRNLTDLMDEGKIKAFIINSSYGMTGFVLAEEMTIK